MPSRMGRCLLFVVVVVEDGSGVKIAVFSCFFSDFFAFWCAPNSRVFCIFCRQTLINNPQDFFGTVAKKSLHFTRHLHRPVLGIFW